VSNEILKVHLPKPQETDLPNGIHLMVLEDHRAPLVNMQLIVEGAGGYYDPASSPGLAGFTAALMREGTASKTSEQISEELDRLAATLTVNAGTSSPFATAFASCLNDQVDTLLAMLADVVQHPSFPEAEIGRYKNRQRALLTNQRTQPGFLALERFQAAAYGDHPGARVSASPAALDALTREPRRRDSKRRSDQSRLRRADRCESHSGRRSERPTVRTPSRAEGLHVRRLQQLLGGTIPRFVERVD
jgi:zinc protease